MTAIRIFSQPYKFIDSKLVLIQVYIVVSRKTASPHFAAARETGVPLEQLHSRNLLIEVGVLLFELGDPDFFWVLLKQFDLQCFVSFV